MTHKQPSTKNPKVMFSSLGAQARAAALHIMKQGRLKPWAALEYQDPTNNWHGSLPRFFSIESLLSNAKRQEPLPRPTLLSDLDIFYDCPGLVYCLDYMQNRLYDGLTTTQEQRRSVSTHLISFWSGELSSDSPDLVISQSAPHEIADFALYILCLRKGIPWISLQYNPWGHRPVRLTSDSYGNLRSLPIETCFPPPLSRSSQAEYVERLLARFRQNQAWEDRHDMRAAKAIKPKLQSLTSMKIALKASIKGLLLQNNSVDRAYLRWLEREQSPLPTFSETDLSSNYIYFPLNYQPELTTCPLGGMFCDQISAIRAVASALPKDWFVFVKEHPGQYLRHSYGYLGRSDLFYSQIISIPQVRLLPTGIHSQRLIDGSRLVATLTGSAGYEALARSKCVIFFGDVWYEEVDGSFRIYKPSEVRPALLKALSYRIDPEKVSSKFHEIAEQSLPFFGEQSSALSYGYPWDPNKEQLTMEEFLHNITSCEWVSCADDRDFHSLPTVHQ